MSTALPNTPTAIEHSTLASSTARRQGAQLVWTLAGGLTLLLSYGIAMALERADVVTHQFTQTVLWCTLPYLLAAHWIYSGAGLPAAERTSLLLVTTVTPFLLLLLGFALLQQPYSRGAVLLVYVLSTAWFFGGDWLRRGKQAQRLACLDANIPDLLNTLCGKCGLGGKDIELVPWPADGLQANSAVTFDGVLVDRRVPASHTRSQLLTQLKLGHVRLYSVEAVAELLSGRKMLPADKDELWQMDGNPAYDVAKRAIDAVLVLLTLPLWLPLCALVGLAVKIDSPGPMLFSQSRIGRDGHSFRLWKFRSMRHHSQAQPARFAQQQDDRVTLVGRTIRRWRLDELPQLVNVLLGHMSLIGPRPEQDEFAQAFAARIPAYPYRHLVRPGLTGWAQVNQGYADGEEETVVKLSYDLYYVAHYSTALDLLIVYKTIQTLLNGFGVR
jgi:lipopolysaccharide/colanic/teichoic acid biosynthesis glycosyltransferase